MTLFEKLASFGYVNARSLFSQIGEKGGLTLSHLDVIKSTFPFMLDADVDAAGAALEQIVTNEHPLSPWTVTYSSNMNLYFSNENDALLVKLLLGP